MIVAAVLVTAGKTSSQRTPSIVTKTTRVTVAFTFARAAETVASAARGSAIGGGWGASGAFTSAGELAMTGRDGVTPHANNAVTSSAARPPTTRASTFSLCPVEGLTAKF